MKEAKLHITDEEMQLYINNQLPAHHRQRVELEIQLCETCLEMFIYWNSRTQLAYSPQSEQAAQQIFEAIEAERTRPKRKWIQSPLAQIAIAASITLLLISTGAMSMISSSIAHIEETGMQLQGEQLRQNADQANGQRQPSTHIEHNGDNEIDTKVVNDNQSGSTESTSEKWLDKATSWIEKIKASRFD